MDDVVGALVPPENVGILVRSVRRITIETSCNLTVSMLQFAASFDLNEIGYVGGVPPFSEYRQ